MRPTSIGVEYLEMRELGFLSPMSTSSLQRLYTVHVGRELKEGADNEPMERCASQTLAHEPDLSCCVVVLQVDLASVAHAVAWD